MSRQETKKRSISQATNDIEKILERSNDDDCGLEIRTDDVKGRGIFTTAPIKKGKAVLEYAGELLRYSEGSRREDDYADTNPYGSGYMFFFKSAGENWAIDATSESGRFARLINHSKRIPNLIPKLHIHKGVPHMLFFATRDIEMGEELLYDYGERRPEFLKRYPWLKT